jgi:hypothetical protein
VWLGVRGCAECAALCPWMPWAESLARDARAECYLSAGRGQWRPGAGTEMIARLVSAPGCAPVAVYLSGTCRVPGRVPGGRGRAHQTLPNIRWSADVLDHWLGRAEQPAWKFSESISAITRLPGASLTPAAAPSSAISAAHGQVGKGSVPSRSGKTPPRPTAGRRRGPAREVAPPRVSSSGRTPALRRGHGAGPATTSTAGRLITTLPALRTAVDSGRPCLVEIRGDPHARPPITGSDGTPEPT